MHAIYYISKNINPTEQNCITTEKEFLAIVYAINKFRHYINGYKKNSHTDHATI